jgi:hypothetical protein
MRIAFDLDDTLIPAMSEFPTECGVSMFLGKIFFRERLRKRARGLLKDLRREGHEIWIYTTSLRDPWYLKMWFWGPGIRLSGVVNQTIHQQVVTSLPTPFCSASKYPPAFGIDILIDDSEGVLLEGQRYGFEVIQVDPKDSNWAYVVRNAITHY